MDYKNILVSFGGEIGFLTINRPKALNSLNTETLQDIQMGMQEVRNNHSCKVLILTGAGDKAFVAGADISEMKGMNSLEALNFSKLGHSTLKMIQDLDRPVIAAVNGYALGGGTEIAVACDFVYASENARFGVPEVTLGIFPGFGGTQRIPRLIGKGKAKELIYTGKMVTQYLLSSQGDRVSMAHSVEGRFPFLDYRIVEFCCKLPPEMKLFGLNEKFLLRRLASKWLPDEIWQRRKRPYRAPIHRSFVGPGAALEYVRELLSEECLEASGLFNPKAVQQMLTKLEAGKRVGETDDMALAGILSTQLVWRQFIVDFQHRMPPAARPEELTKVCTKSIIR